MAGIAASDPRFRPALRRFCRRCLDRGTLGIPQRPHRRASLPRVAPPFRLVSGDARPVGVDHRGLVPSPAPLKRIRREMLRVEHVNATRSAAHRPRTRVVRAASTSATERNGIPPTRAAGRHRPDTWEASSHVARVGAVPAHRRPPRFLIHPRCWVSRPRHHQKGWVFRMGKKHFSEERIAFVRRHAASGPTAAIAISACRRPRGWSAAESVCRKATRCRGPRPGTSHADVVGDGNAAVS